MRQYAGKFALIFREFSGRVHKKQCVYGNVSPVTDQVIEKLCEELNATDTVFPRTNLRLVLQMGFAEVRSFYLTKSNKIRNGRKS
jgi:hypothetical protein